MPSVRKTVRRFRDNSLSSKTRKDNSHQQLPFFQSLSKEKPSKDYPFANNSSIIPNPYLKSFNLRKIYKTESSSKKNIKADVEFEIGNKISSLQKVDESFNHKQKNKRSNGIRVHTEKLRNRASTLMKNSPYKMKKARLQTIDHEEIQTNNKYKTLTVFQRDEIHRFEVHFVGKRRIKSPQCFTDLLGNARVAMSDSIIYRYEILDILGKGSFGQVFKAFDHKKKQLVAIKIIRNQPKFCTQAKVEIKILQHVLIKDSWAKSNIIQMKHAFFFRGHPCLVFELLDQNLYEFMRSLNFTGISIGLILRFAIQILQATLFLHKYQIIHCDLKPQNILLKQKNKTGIKIIDIGSGCYQNEQIYTYIQSRFYRAPEIILGIPYTTAIDIWSLGCILMELYLGYPFFPGEDQNQQIAMFMEYLGVPPAQLIQRGIRSKKFFVDNQPKFKANKKGILRKPNSKNFSSIIKEGDLNFIDFLEQCFVWEPTNRITAESALLHPWILDGLPEQIKEQHIIQLKRNLQL